uniref:Cellular inhibitor of PP2A n=1 Tax=Callorhinchus milii TaxID=7868 RepID=A0A4W3JYK4_CALMI
MDLTTCMKSLLLAISQYKNVKSEVNASQVQRQLDVIYGMKAVMVFASNQSLPSECLNSLVELIADPNTTVSLTLKIIGLLTQLASDNESREALNTIYNLISTLAAVVHHNSATPSEQVVLQLLQKITYNTRVFHGSANIDDLFAFLVKHIQAPEDEITMPCLGLMANLCRHNVAIQAHIKSLNYIKGFYRTLIRFLGHSSLTVVVFALSILASLTLNEEVGEKLFHAKNIHQTFQLIFNILINGDGTLTRKYTVDLLVDLLRNPKIADYLQRYEYFNSCLSQVLGLLHGKDSDSATKILELLLAFCSVTSLRRILCHAMFGASFQQSLVATKLKPQVKPSEPIISLLHWSSQPLENPESCSLLALVLLKELFEEVVDSSLWTTLQPFLELLLPVLLEQLQIPEHPLEGGLVKKKYDRIAKTIDVLLDILCEQILTSLGYLHLLCWSSAIMMSRCSVLLRLHVFLSHLILTKQKSIPSMQHVLCYNVLQFIIYVFLQDQRLITPLSFALTSEHRDHVQLGLQILFEAAPLPEFPAVLLGEAIAANNACKQQQFEHVTKKNPVQQHSTNFIASWNGSHPKPSNNASASRENIHELIQKLQSGIELKEQVKDVRLSEMMDVYEQKLSSLASKETRLQDLLEAKALALAQADRLIAQYRCQRAHAEAEARQLASLLMDAERKNEELDGVLKTQLMETECAKSDMEQLFQDNRKLQTVAEEHESLKVESVYRAQRLVNIMLFYGYFFWLFSKKQFEQQHQERTNSAIELILQTAMSPISNARIIIINLSIHLNKLRLIYSLTGLQQKIKAQEEKAKKMEKEKNDMEETIDILRKELSKTELTRKELSIKVSSLEVQKIQLEGRLKEKEALLKVQEEELGKHSHMIAMIHSLSGGKVQTNTVNLNL